MAIPNSTSDCIIVPVVMLIAITSNTAMGILVSFLGESSLHTAFGGEPRKKFLGSVCSCKEDIAKQFPKVAGLIYSLPAVIENGRFSTSFFFFFFNVDIQFTYPALFTEKTTFSLLNFCFMFSLNEVTTYSQPNIH